MTFKPGDVVRRSRKDGIMRVGVVVDPDGFDNTFYSRDRRRPMVRGNVWAFWCTEGEWIWGITPAHTAEPVELHPDPDPILAKFTAWRLTQ